MTPNPTLLRIAVCQMCSTHLVADNLASMVSVLKSLDQVDFVSFPENCLFMRLEEGLTIPELSLSDSLWNPLQEEARRLGAVLHLGSVALKMGGRIYNSTILIYPDGRVEAPYQKIHLFDVDVVGHVPVRESDIFARGERPAVVEVQGWKLGLSICYDLRFSPLFAHYQIQGVDAVLVPAAFLVPTGKAHWEILLRARAIETQSYVIAAAQGGSHLGKRETFGNSLVVGPWGEVVARADQAPLVLRAEISKARIGEVRRQIPMSSHRRPWNLV